MIIICDTCEKDLSDCTCIEDLVNKLGVDKCLEIEESYNKWMKMFTPSAMSVGLI